MDCGREKGKLLLNGYRISICDERNGSGNIVVVSGLQHKCNWCPLIVHLNVGKWHILCYISNFPTKKGDSLFQTLQSREVMATSRFHVPRSCKCGLLSPFVWVQILPLLLPVPLGARDSDFGTSVSSSVKRRQITPSLPRKVAMRKLQSPYTVTGTEKTLAEYGSSPLLGELHQSAGRRHGASEGGLWDRCWGESFAALDSDFPRRSQWDGSWRALCPGLSPSGDQRPQRTPWSSAASPLHPLHYRRRENSKAFSNSTSLLLESSPKPWIRLTRHLLIESIYFSLLNSQHTSSHPLRFNCVDAHSAIWKAPYLPTSLGSLLPALGLCTSQEGFSDSLRPSHMRLPWAGLMFFPRLLPLRTHSVVIACFLIIFPVRS